MYSYTFLCFLLSRVQTVVSTFQRHRLGLADFSCLFIFPSILMINFLCFVSHLFFCLAPHSSQNLVCSGGLNFPTSQDWIFSIWSARDSFISSPSLFNFFCCKNISLVFSWSSALLSFYCNIFTTSLSCLI